MKKTTFRSLLLMGFLVFSTLTSFGQDLQITTNAVTCFGNNDGSVTVTLVSTQNCGNGPYQYQLTGPIAITSPITASSSFTFNNLSPGSYTINILVNGFVCTQSFFFITQPTPINATISNIINILCFGTPTGAATVNASNGTAPYNISWAGPMPGNPNGIEINASGGAFNINSLLAGNYTATVTDANGCSTTTPFTITQPSPIQSPFTITSVLCNGTPTGSVLIQGSGGSAPYNVVWSGPSSGNPPGIEINASGGSYVIASLLAGSYTVSIIDANGCIETTNFAITQPLPLTITGIIGANNIDITVGGGVPPYVYSWSNGSTTEDLNNLSSGTYTVTITDQNGCQSSQSFTIQNQNPPLAISGTPTNSCCAGAAQGSILVVATGGSAPYDVSLTGPVNFNPAGNEILASGGSYVIASLLAGSYTVLVTDANGNSQSLVVTITEPLPLAAYSVQSNSQCFGTCTGSINLTVTGGVAPYVYTWTGIPFYSSSNQNLSNLCPGVYTVSVTDACGCTNTLTQSIISPPAFTLTGIITQIPCGGLNNGAIDVTVGGGTPGFTYAWTGPFGYTANTEDLLNLTPGTYTLTATDANQCTTTGTWTINGAPPALNLQASVTSLINCFGQTGEITATVTGGTANYTLSGIGANQTLTSANPTHLYTGLNAGTYTITVTDSNGCTDVDTVVLMQPNLLTLSASTPGILCNGQNASVTLTPSGGTPVYTYTGAATSGLAPGTYTYTVTDANSCTANTSITITQPSALVVTAAVGTAIPCSGGQGVVTVSAVGGTPAYIGTGNFTVSAGTHTFTVTDANGCTANSSATITEPLHLLLTGSVNGNNIDISVSGGTVPYNYSWSNGSVTQDLPNVPPGTYVVIVTDAFNCSISDTFTVDNAGLEQQQSIELQVFPNPAQGVVTIRSSSTSIGNTYRMLDCYGRNVLEGTLTSQENNINIQTLANGLYHLQLGANTVSFVVSH